MDIMIKSILTNHKKGGMKYSKLELLRMQHYAICESIRANDKSYEQKFPSYYENINDSFSKQNVCDTKDDFLNEITLSEMAIGKIEPDTIMWVKTITDAC